MRARLLYAWINRSNHSCILLPCQCVAVLLPLFHDPANSLQYLSSIYNMHIRLATLEDCSTTASFSVLGFDNDELFEWMNPRRREYPDHFRYYFLRRHQTRYWSSKHVFYVALTDEQDEDWSGAGQVIGYAIWQRRGESDVADA